MTKGFTFNGTHSSNVDGVTGVLSYGFPFMPDMDNNTVKMKGMNGAIDGGKTSEPRPFEVELLIDGDTIEDYFLKTFAIEKWLNTETVQPFIFDVLPDRRLMARVTSKADPDRIAGYSKVKVEFTAYDPYFEAITLNTHNLTESTVYGYSGNKETDVVITTTVNASLSFFKITHEQSGKFILIHQAVIAGDIVKIDTAKRTIQINGGDVRGLTDVKSRYFTINGNYSFNTNAVSPTMVISYRERW